MSTPPMRPAGALPNHGPACAMRLLAKISETVAKEAVSTIRTWIARSRQRRAFADLAEFNAHLLKDIGVSRDEALREAEKWFWHK